MFTIIVIQGGQAAHDFAFQRRGRPGPRSQRAHPSVYWIFQLLHFCKYFAFYAFHEIWYWIISAKLFWARLVQAQGQIRFDLTSMWADWLTIIRNKHATKFWSCSQLSTIFHLLRLIAMAGAQSDPAVESEEPYTLGWSTVRCVGVNQIRRPLVDLFLLLVVGKQLWKLSALIMNHDSILTWICKWFLGRVRTGTPVYCRWQGQLLAPQNVRWFHQLAFEFSFFRWHWSWTEKELDRIQCTAAAADHGLSAVSDSNVLDTKLFSVIECFIQF